MDSIEKQQRKREARRRLRAQRERAGRLRGRVVASSLIVFALLWGGVFIQMATGNDPVLGNRPASAAGPPRGGRGKAKAASGAGEASAPAEAEAAEAPVIEPEPAPVTTGQS